MAKSRIAKMLARARPSSMAYHSQKEEDQRKLTLAEKVHIIHGSPRWKSASLWSKLAGAMTGVTNIARGRAAGAAGVSMATVPGKALSTQAVNPNRSLRSAISASAPKSPTVAAAAAPKV